MNFLNWNGRWLNDVNDGNTATASIQIVVLSTKTFLQFVLETR